MSDDWASEWYAEPASRWMLWCVLAALMLGSMGQYARAQAFPMADGTAFGRSVPLRDEWVAVAGDDPRWAQPGTDDSRWTRLEQGRPLTAQGFGEARSIWFRTHVRLRPGAPAAAVYVEHLDFNYSVYANGQWIGQQGAGVANAANGEHPPEGFLIPAELLRGTGGDLVLAIRVLSGPIGFLNLSPMRSTTRMALIGPEDLRFRMSYRLAHDWAEPLAVMALNFLVGLCGFVIWWSLREQREYLALALWAFGNMATILAEFLGHLHQAGLVSVSTLLVVLFEAVSSVAELEFMRLLLKQRRNRFWSALETTIFLVLLLDPLVSAGKIPLSFGVANAMLRPLTTELFVGVLLMRGVLRGNRDAPWLLLPVALWSLTDVYRFAQLTAWFSARTLLPDLPKLPMYSYSVSTQTVSNVLGLLSLVLIILQRTVRLSQDKAELAAEVSAAEELQLLLMARASRPTPGFRVDTAYRPMQQVGGDFFLVSPCEDDQSLVAIVGDVSGKGLQAAMRVSLILGVLQREVMSQPDKVLKKLNAALMDQSELGFTTACCVRLEADGSFCFANAGHLNPYVDGQELVSEGALPLGMDADASYPVMTGRLLRGEQMMLLSDGVVEARSRKGELFGFARAQEAVRGSAMGVVEAAQRFGQEDDITVLAVALA